MINKKKPVLKYIEKVTGTKEQFLKEFKQSVDEVNLAKQRKIKLKTAEQLLNEL